MVKQYVVVPRSGASDSTARLLQCVDICTRRSDITIKRIVGDEDNPKRLIIAANPEVADELLLNFGNWLIIEENQPLRY